MDKLWKQIEKENAEKVKELFETKLQEAYEEYLAEKIANRDYEIAGGYRSFQRDLERLNKEYTSVLRDYGESEVLTILLYRYSLFPFIIFYFF